MTKKFKLTRIISGKVSEITEETAPSWLTSEKSVPGSTDDYRWFWTDYVLKLEVGQRVSTDFIHIDRIE